MPRYIYEEQPGGSRRHRSSIGLNVPEPDARALHAAAFLRLWLFQHARPWPLSERLARGQMLGFGAEFFEMKGVERVATFHKPLRLPPEPGGADWRWSPGSRAGGGTRWCTWRCPTSPFRLRGDCSDASGETDLLQQTDCSLLLLRRFVDLLRGLDRFDDSTILVHGDHGSGLVVQDGRFVEDESAWYRTLLLVKPAGARGPLRLSEEAAHLEDIAPTLLSLLEIGAGDGYEGRVLEDAVAPGGRGAGPPGGTRFDCQRTGGYHAEYTRALSEIWPSSRSSPRASPPHAFRGSLSRTSTARP